MGNCNPGPAGAGMSKEDKKKARDEYLKSKELDKQNLQDMENDSLVCKLLLLGAGESGKSTLFKQICSIYGEGFNQKQLNRFAPSIFQNVISSMRQLVEQSDLLDEKYDCRIRPENREVKAAFLKNDGTSMDVIVGQQIKTLWTDKGIQNTYQFRSRYQFLETANYFFDRIDQISAENYEPTYDDVLRCRVRTTGIVETQFEIANHKFLLIDVGGQRNERKKWIHSFENVTAMIFVTALSEYDQLLFEDNQTNRLVESLNLFDEMCQSRWFAHSPIILFLNKHDLFEAKVKTSPIKNYFVDYTGGDSYADALKYMQDKFLSKVPPKRLDQTYVHVTCATDKDNVAHVFHDVKEIFIKKNLHDSGLQVV